MNIFILAGEPSGDEYGAKLMEQLKKNNPKITFNGIGGSLMSAQGLNSMAPFQKMSVMGFAEVIKSLFFFINLEKKILTLFKKNRPDKIILIDYPGFNLRLSKKIKSQTNVPIIYYISPQIWAWKENRITTIKKYVDEMIVIFEFEKNWYKSKKLNVNYGGHPFLDIWQPNQNLDSLLLNHRIDLDQPILTLFPGSRQQEIDKHLHLFVKAALKIKKTIPNLQILLGLHSDVQLKQSVDQHITIINDEPLKALEVATAAIVSSGTATLQAAIMNTPAVVVYKMNKISWWLTKKLVQVNFASMANIIAEKLVFPELLQNDATENNISNHIIKMINEPEYRKKLMAEIKIIQEKVGEPGASKRAAQYIESV